LRAVELTRKLARAHPSTNRYQSDLASASLELGNTEAAMELPDEALPNFQLAAELWDTLLKASPRAVPYQQDRFRALSAIAELHQKSGRAGEAVAAMREAVLMWDRAVSDQPDDPQLRVRQADAYHRLGHLCAMLDRNAEAEHGFQRAFDAISRLTGPVADDPGNQNSRLSYIWLLAASQRKLGRAEVAERNLSLARSIADALFDRCRTIAAAVHPADRRSRGSRTRRPQSAPPSEPSSDQAQEFHIIGKAASTFSALGLEIFQAGLVAESKCLLDRSRQLVDDAAGMNVSRALSWTATASADSSRSLGADSFAIAITDLPNLNQLHDQVLADGALAPLRDPLLRYDYDLIHVLLNLRRPDELAAVTRLWLRVQGENAITWYNGACYFARSASFLPDDNPATHQRRAELVNEAMAGLRLALRLGWRNYGLTSTDPDLDSLRTRADFQAMLMDLALPAQPFAR
jgi:tetratricopeptide (TPR) repeat protein